MGTIRQFDSFRGRVVSFINPRLLLWRQRSFAPDVPRVKVTPSRIRIAKTS